MSVQENNDIWKETDKKRLIVLENIEKKIQNKEKNRANGK